MYLRQLEAESRVEEVYGKGVQLIVPEAGFVVKTADKVWTVFGLVPEARSPFIDPIAPAHAVLTDNNTGMPCRKPGGRPLLTSATRRK